MTVAAEMTAVEPTVQPDRVTVPEPKTAPEIVRAVVLVVPLPSVSVPVVFQFAAELMVQVVPVIASVPDVTSALGELNV